MRHFNFFLLIALICLAAVFAVAQQEYVSKYDTYVGYGFLTTPSLNLFQNGVAAEFGVNVRRWLALGGDFSYFDGSNSLTPRMFNAKTQAQLAQFLPLFPPGYRLAIPTNTSTYTYTAGTQFNYRRLKQVTFFIHPDIGAMYMSAHVHPKDPIQQAVVAALLGPGQTNASDWSAFLGVGGGMDFNISQHVGVRTFADFVHTTLFNGLLPGQNSVRFSISPTFRFGPNVPR